MSGARRIEPDPPTHRGGSGEPLVLIHGGGGTPRLWRTTIPLLEPHHDVLAVTLDGHFGGRPIPPATEASVETLALGVERDMDAAGFDTAHVAGGSLGGWVALELARRGRARSVVAIAPAGGWEKGSAEWRQLVWTYRIVMAGSRLFARWPHALASRPRLRRLAAWHHFAHPERMDAGDFAYMIAGAAGFDSMEAGIAWDNEHGGARGLDEIPPPVLLAFPEKDRILPRRRYGERLVAGIPHAEVVDLPGAGHAAMVDDPELVARTILDFTARASERAAAVS
ncbi:MAG TPA: alpha/beta fold hydrolase [Thermoleophilaceae bacterium]|nr:alpha/beta fold hydrolase [Thermoleophilaceae bacterium]